MFKKLLIVGVLFSFATIALAPALVFAQPAGIPNATPGGLPTQAVQAKAPPGCTNMKTTGLPGVVECVISIFNDAIYLMMAGAVVFTVWGAFQMIYSEDKRSEGRQRIYNGVIGLFVMISIWGFVNILDKTFNLSGSPIPATKITPP